MERTREHKYASYDYILILSEDHIKLIAQTVPLLPQASKRKICHKF